jgi:hypothetical protein
VGFLRRSWGRRRLGLEDLRGGRGLHGVLVLGVKGILVCWEISCTKACMGWSSSAIEPLIGESKLQHLSVCCNVRKFDLVFTALDLTGRHIHPNEPASARQVDVSP